MPSMSMRIRAIFLSLVMNHRPLHHSQMWLVWLPTNNHSADKPKARCLTIKLKLMEPLLIYSRDWSQRYVASWWRRRSASASRKCPSASFWRKPRSIRTTCSRRWTRPLKRRREPNPRPSRSKNRKPTRPRPRDRGSSGRSSSGPRCRRASRASRTSRGRSLSWSAASLIRKTRKPRRRRNASGQRLPLWLQRQLPRPRRPPRPRHRQLNQSLVVREASAAGQNFVNA